MLDILNIISESIDLLNLIGSMLPCRACKDNPGACAHCRGTGKSMGELNLTGVPQLCSVCYGSGKCQGCGERARPATQIQTLFTRD